MVDTAVRPQTDAGYEQDFYAWTQAQAAALRAQGRAGTNAPVDWENVAEEIESLGRSDARELRSRIATIIEHLLKLEFSQAAEPARAWRETIARSRVAFRKLIDESPSLKARIEPWIEAEHDAAIGFALRNLGDHGELPPQVEEAVLRTRYSRDQVLGDWFPPR